ncbi:hypothetical protein J437_LFUL011994 [Ladona fulva]|uniref:RNA polymerase II elongation factor ELL N-terminal domain-containing protein n=1 Tax=Ladona fulva TaxID=123851 RepID=A0A8K0KLZ2_LADFU|nr:hypothetical protein J437_LFUL011994 [Ladona fulva]
MGYLTTLVINHYISDKSPFNDNVTAENQSTQVVPYLQLSFPNPSSNGHGAAFNFSLSGNEDIEGPQGSFECLQSKSKSFEFMGTLPCKMRIQATDDVYAATKQRMAVVEEQQKKNCTRVIKVSDVGRKVKVKKIGSVGALPKRETSPPSYRPPLSTVSVGANKPRNTFSQSRSDGCNNGSSGHLDGHPTLPTNMHPNVHHGRIPSGGRTRGNQDIMRRPIRPLKMEPLNGLRDRDRATLAIVLKQVANMSDNTYHLNRHVWNDVQEDWPFYSEQDKQILKRRKPQNLTPPGSDGSSGSGHSPTSTHPGSPPPTIFPSPSGTNCRLPGPDPSGVKRPGYYDNADGIITKKQRISHFKRLPTESSSSSVTNNNNNNSSNNSSNVQRVRSDSVTRRTQDLPPRPGGSPGHHPSRNRPHPASPGHGRAMARRDEVEALHSPEDGVTVSRRVEEEVESGQWPPVKDKSVWSSGKSNVRSTSPEELVKSEERVSEAASSAKGKVVGAEEEAESDRASSEYPDYLT